MKVLSISGSGRSGSTLLALLLTQGDDVANLCQVRDFWTASAQAAPCSCGRSVMTCAFWAPVVREAFGPSPRRRIAKMQRRRDAFREDATAIGDWTNAEAIPALARRHAKYLDGLGDFLSAAGDVANVDALVDASKSPEVALAFSLVRGVDLRVLDLLRDPRAVACSWERKLDRQAAITATDGWGERQQLLARWAPSLGERFRELRYEDLASTPRASVDELLAWTELAPAPDLFATETHAQLSWDRQHLFPPANETVLAEQRTSVDVLEATEWREDRWRSTREMVEARLGDVMERYGYVRVSSD